MSRTLFRYSPLLVATLVVTSCSFFNWFDSATPTPTILWHVVDSGVSTPAFDSASGTAFFLARDHRVVAVDMRGNKRWEGRTFDGAGHTFGFGGCAAAATVVVCNDSGLVGLRQSNGARAWQFVPAVGKYPGYAGFVVWGDVVYAGSPAGDVYAVDALTGAQRWKQPAPAADTVSNVNVLGLITDGQTVFAPYTQFIHPLHGGVMAVDAASGQLLWTTAIRARPPTQRPVPSAWSFGPTSSSPRATTDASTQ